jgi:hypothetical protein
MIEEANKISEGYRHRLDERASPSSGLMPHLNPLITLSTEMGHREPMTFNAFLLVTGGSHD